MRMALLGLLLAAALSGCQATRYQPSADTGGFAELELVDEIWRIRFAGNAHTTRETARTYWLYRAAELTLSKGYDGFEVLPQIGQVRSHGDPRSRGSAVVIEGEIRMLKAPFESVPPRTFSADSLRAALDPYVNGGKCDTRTTSGNVCRHAHDYLLAKSGPKPVASKAETPPPSSDGLRPKTSESIPAAAPAVKSKPAPVVAWPQARPAEDAPKQTGPCEIKPVMTDQELVNCGARVR